MRKFSFSRALGGATLTFALALGLSVGAATPAQAAGAEACASGKTCVWQAPYYITDGNSRSLVAFSQCVHDYTKLKYSLTGLSAGADRRDRQGNVFKVGFSNSVYNNGNYQTVTMYSGANYTNSTWNGYGPDSYGHSRSTSSYRIAKKTGDEDISDSYYVKHRVPPVSGIFDTVSKSCRN